MNYDLWQASCQVSDLVPGELVKDAAVRNWIMFGTG